ncbi:hypothetical protein NQ176_g10067 [Zarea fungicola]|uniref:Uncharacterized protein n=1 Tax=Zarea fungicola TaxID=93591 RepID=A0ACC1MK11_9HYPO|nr:hypothetical protein NQ176_g10067 [Lecanicillium fungicola]
MAFRQPGEGSPSFAQTGAELDLYDSDDDDLFNLEDYDEGGYQKAVESTAGQLEERNIVVLIATASETPEEDEAWEH